MKMLVDLSARCVCCFSTGRVPLLRHCHLRVAVSVQSDGALASHADAQTRVRTQTGTLTDAHTNTPPPSLSYRHPPTCTHTHVCTQAHTPVTVYVSNLKKKTNPLTFLVHFHRLHLYILIVLYTLDKVDFADFFLGPTFVILIV